MCAWVRVGKSALEGLWFLGRDGCRLAGVDSGLEGVGVAGGNALKGAHAPRCQ